MIFGIGCSLRNLLRRSDAEGQDHDPRHARSQSSQQGHRVILGLIGDAALTLDALLEELKSHLKAKRDGKAVAGEIAEMRKAWLEEWLPKLTSKDTPLSPYRVLWDLLHTVDVKNTIITHDAGSPRDQLSPFWQSTEPLSYIGWGKTTQLGYGRLAMGPSSSSPTDASTWD